MTNNLSDKGAPRPHVLFVGIATIDILYRIEEIPGRNTKISTGNQLVCAGGPATNAAITFAFLGGHAELATALGRHALTEVVRQELRQFGVEVHDVAPERDNAPPLASILVIRETGERTVIAPGDKAFPTMSRYCPPEPVAKASMVLVDGLYMPLCVAAAAEARSRGIPVVLDGGSWKPGMDELLPLVTTAICSDDFCPPGCRDQSDVFAFLQAQEISQIAITRGEKPARYLEGDVVREVEVPQIEAKDTLGAGDIFHGAFCYYLSQAPNELAAALKQAARVASFSCRFYGTRSWMEAFRANAE